MRRAKAFAATVLGAGLLIAARADAEAAPAPPPAVTGPAEPAPPERPPTRAVKPPSPREKVFGEQGEFAVTLALASLTEDRTELALGLSPGVDYFVSDQISLGVGVLAEHVFHDSIEANAMGVRVNVGHSLDFMRYASLWARLSGSLVRLDPGANYVRSTIELPVLVHVVPRFFVAVGPYLAAVRYLDSTMPGIHLSGGLTGFIGGWF